MDGEALKKLANQLPAPEAPHFYASTRLQQGETKSTTRAITTWLPDGNTLQDVLWQMVCQT